jgi:release factor glutamine methyltransferase
MPQTHTVKDLLQSARQRLQHLDSARLDAEVLLAAVTGSGRESLYSYPERQLEEGQAVDFNTLINHRRRGFPVAYLTGSREFWSLEFKVNRDTLIPRPETELLVETALAHIAEDAALDILDLGTGCGAIAVALAGVRPRWRVTAADLSGAALDVARENAARAGVANIDFVQSDWFAGLTGRLFHLIVCNPPYVESSHAGFSGGELRFEPRLALDGGHTGLEALQRIIPAAARNLHPGGQLFLEHGHTQGREVRRLLQLNRYRDELTLKDYAGLERLTLAVMP